MKTGDNVVLVGMSGAGKSTAGVLLAKRLGYAFADTDLLLCCEYGEKLPDILDRLGYEGFLRAEEKVGETLCCERTVIATGGSMIFGDRAMRNLKSLGKVVYLSVPPEQLQSRIGGDVHARGIAMPRPMTVPELCAYREPYYIRYADITVCAASDIETTVQTIINKIVIDTDERV